MDASNDSINYHRTADGKRVISWLTTTTDVKENNVDGTFTWHLAANQGVSAPRHIFIAMHNSDRLGRQLSSHMIFDRLGVSEVSMRINGQQEPTEDIQLDYDNNQIARVYHGQQDIQLDTATTK